MRSQPNVRVLHQHPVAVFQIRPFSPFYAHENCSCSCKKENVKIKKIGPEEQANKAQKVALRAEMTVGTSGDAASAAPHSAGAELS